MTDRITKDDVSRAELEKEAASLAYAASLDRNNPNYDKTPLYIEAQRWFREATASLDRIRREWDCEKARLAQERRERNHKHYLAEQLAQRDGGWRCHYCHAPLTLETATLDHKKPASHGGSTVLINLVLCCLTCNMQKGNRHSYEAFYAKTAPKRVRTPHAQ